MASNVLLTDFDYVYPGQLATNVLIKPALEHPDALQLFRVLTGIRSKRVLHLVNQLGKTVKGAQLCGNTRVPTGEGVSITNRTLEVDKLELYLEQCYDVFENTVMEELLKTGVEEADLSGTVIQGIINELIATNLKSEFFRLFSFGDKDSGINDYYNSVDGLWPTLIDAATTYEVQREADITALSQTVGERTFDYLRTIHENAPILLKQVPNNQKKFYVTGKMYENLMTTYEDTDMAAVGITARVENGVMSLMFRGIDVVPVYAWDQWIEADGLGNNCRMLYTSTDNHVIGIENASDRDAYRVRLDEDLDIMKYRAKFKLGYNFVFGDFTVIKIGNV
jgi:hypothetical protein